MAVPKIRNCARCGKLYLPTLDQKTCPECMRRAEEQFTAVQRYLREHPKASVDEIAEECDLSADIVMDFVREGRLEIDLPAGGGSVVCRVCGKPVEHGTMCAKCQRIASQLEGLKASREQSAQKAAQRPAAGGSDRPTRTDRGTGYVDHRGKGS
jgi:hypothetical protein